MFRSLLSYPQEALHNQRLVYCMRMSVGCGTVAVKLCYSPKHVEALSFNKVKLIVKCIKLVRVIELYHDARSTKH
jgi:hypothetical protein